MNKIYPYNKDHRFFVAAKLDRNQRFRSDFKYLHASRELAEAEARRLAEKHRRKFYVGEIQAITVYEPDGVAAVGTDCPGVAEVAVREQQAA
ncbi:MAG: hypothetical protein ACK4S4_15545 [Pyrinomonadaceae bacterium]